MMRAELDRIKLARLKLEQKVAGARSKRALSERIAMVSSELGVDPIGIYNALTYPERAAPWQLVLMDESGVVRALRVRRVGSNKFSPVYEADWRDLVGSGEKTWIPWGA